MDQDLDRELAYHEKLYAGFAQQHFAKPAVRAMREHLVRRVRTLLNLNSESRVLSIGCGIGDTELLLAPQVGHVTGIDLSPSAIAQAEADAKGQGVHNFTGICGTLDACREGEFDAAIAIFFLHHVSEGALTSFPGEIGRLIKLGGGFYSLDPSRYRLSGFLGELLLPNMMARYQSPGERQLSAIETATLFERSGFEARYEHYDFVSTPLAGLAPEWRAGYRLARFLDNALVRIPVLKMVSSNFEIVARRK